jgi:cell division septal protein FtsQ
MVLKKKERLDHMSMKISAWTVVKAALAAFLVRIAFYLIVSLLFVWLMSWASIIPFNFRYVIVSTVGIFLFYILFGKFSARY